MSDSPNERISRFLSLVLRHEPSAANVSMDRNGWVRVESLLKGLTNKGYEVTREILDTVVSTNNKKRFEYSEDGNNIRASQGHSVTIDLGYKPETPPDTLYHGTTYRFIHLIKQTGLAKQKRHAVHLSLDVDTAINVGSRHGKPCILIINAKQMAEDGFKFYKSANGVWLVDSVPMKYINFQ